MDILVFVLVGLLVGSFINAAEYRYYRQLPISWDKIKKKFTRSMCVHCQEELRTVDLIPVVSFFWLRGRCRHCRTTIAWQYPAVELATAGLFALSAWTYGVSFEAGIVALISAILVFLFLYDLKYQLIPDAVSLPAIMLAIPAGLLLGLTWQSMLIGAAIGGGFFGAQYLMSKGVWIGGGDIRVGVLMGLLLGWQHTIFALFVAYIVGGSVATILLATKKMHRKSRLPFGPFLVIGIVCALFFGEPIVNAYALALSSLN